MGSAVDVVECKSSQVGIRWRQDWPPYASVRTLPWKVLTIYDLHSVWFFYYNFFQSSFKVQTYENLLPHLLRAVWRQSIWLGRSSGGSRTGCSCHRYWSHGWHIPIAASILCDDCTIVCNQVQCNECFKWVHATCEGIDDVQYDAISLGTHPIWVIYLYRVSSISNEEGNKISLGRLLYMLYTIHCWMLNVGRRILVSMVSREARIGDNPAA